MTGMTFSRCNCRAFLVVGIDKDDLLFLECEARVVRTWPKNLVKKIPFSGGDEGFLECHMRRRCFFWGGIWDLWVCCIFLWNKWNTDTSEAPPQKSDMEPQSRPHTWRIIPDSKWLGSPPFISHETAIWKGAHNPILRGRNRSGLTNSPWLITTYFILGWSK